MTTKLKRNALSKFDATNMRNALSMSPPQKKLSGKWIAAFCFVGGVMLIAPTISTAQSIEAALLQRAQKLLDRKSVV